MYCPKCGKQMPDDAAFCMACGYQFGENRNVQTEGNSIERQLNTRQDSLNELNRVYAYFAQKGALYDEYDNLQKVITIRSQPYKTLMILGIILTVIGGFFVFLNVVGIREGLIPKGSLSDLIIIELRFLLPLIIGIMLILINHLRNNKRKKALNSTLNRVIEISNELSAYYINYGPCVIGEEFSNPRIIETIIELIKSGRADTPKESINLMLDDAHKTQLQLQNDLQLRSINATKTSSAISAGANVATSVFCTADFFRKLIF